VEFCLTKDKANEFLKKIKSRELDVYKLTEMTSLERRAEFMKKLGLDEETARQVNALFESKLLLKYKTTGIKNWIEKTGNLKEEAKRGLLEQVNKYDKVFNPKDEAAFLEDLASKKLGNDITAEEAKTLFELAKKVKETAAKVGDTPIRSKERMEYGTSLVLFKDYAGKLKLEKAQLKDFLNPGKLLYKVSGIAKSIVSSLDNSFFGRQGIKTLYTRPDIWAINFAKSFGDIGRALAGRDAILPIKADVFSRPNALNKNYKQMKIDIGLASEEAFPSALPERIPLLGRLYKASEAAFNGAALRMRADLADALIRKMEKQGVDIRTDAENVGNLVNSMTGRGSLGKAEAISRELNALMFSAKFLKSNFDTLVAPLQMLTKEGRASFAKRQAAYNFLKIILSIAGILTIAERLNPGSVDFDSRSSNFGKIKIGDTRFDITGGMAALVTLASRIVPTTHNGQWGFWTKNSTTGKFTKMSTGKYGSRSPVDTIEDFFEGKASPGLGLLLDAWEQEFYGGEKWSALGAAKRLVTPFPISTYEDLKKSENASSVLFLILSNLASSLGIGVSTY
jgi:hypothetical protein